MAREDLKYIIGFEVNDTPVVQAAKKMDALNRQQQYLTKIYKSGLLSQTMYKKGLTQVNAEMGRLRTAVQGGDAALQQYITQVQKGEKANKRFQVGIQQAGYQVGDFAVQVQGGTNPLVAFSQQFSQLAGFFGGPWGAAVGAGVAILSGLGVYLMKSNESAKSASQGLKDLEESIKSVDSALKDWMTTKSASEAGVTVDEMLGTNKLGSALSALSAAKKKMTDLLLDAGSMSSGGMGDGSGALTVWLLGRNAQNSIDKAEKAYAAAYVRVSQLQQKLAEDRGIVFDDEMRSLNQEAEMQKTIASYGKDSLEVQKLKDQQSLISYAREVSALDITDKQKILLIEQKDIMLEQERIEAAKLKFLQDEDILMGQAVTKGKESLALEQKRLSLMQTQAALSGDRTTLASQGGRSTGMYGKSGTAFEYTGPKLDENNNVVKDKASKDALEAAKADLALQREIYSTEGARRAGIELLGTEYSNYSTNQIRLLGEEKIAVDAIIAAEEQRIALGDYAASAIEDSLMSMVDGTMSVQDAFKNMAAEIIKELYRVLVVQQMVNNARTYFGFANGGAFSGGSPIAFANGGVVGSPTTFPMSGGKTGLMGEAGPEAIMPLKRGPDGKLGVESNGGGAVTIQQNFNFSANGDESVKKLIAQAAPKIAQMTQQKIVDSRRRGGQMKAVFG